MKKPLKQPLNQCLLSIGEFLDTIPEFIALPVHQSVLVQFFVLKVEDNKYIINAPDIFLNEMKLPDGELH